MAQFATLVAPDAEPVVGVNSVSVLRRMELVLNGGNGTKAIARFNGLVKSCWPAALLLACASTTLNAADAGALAEPDSISEAELGDVLSGFDDEAAADDAVASETLGDAELDDVLSGFDDQDLSPLETLDETVSDAELEAVLGGFDATGADAGPTSLPGTDEALDEVLKETGLSP